MVKSFGFYPLVILILLTGCVERTPYYSDVNNDNIFGAGDTTYVQLSPVWDAAMGLQTPMDISIAQDGLLYIADSAAHRILVLDQGGTPQPAYDQLSGLVDDQGQTISPLDVDIDKKMNVFFIDGSARVFCWNHYWNQTGIDSIAAAATFVHENGSTITLTAGTDEWTELLNDRDWTMTQVQWAAPQAKIDSLLRPHLFYDGANPRHSFTDIHYESELSRFTGITTIKDFSNYIVVSDAGGEDSTDHRLLQIDFQRVDLLKLSTGNSVWSFTGIFGQTVVEYGTGAGFANHPVSVDADENGNLFYTQLGSQFGAHKVRPIVTGSYVTFTSTYTGGVNDIMDLGRFQQPRDIAVDHKGMIYIANTGAREIQVFDFEGGFFKKAGVEETRIDTTIWVFDGADSTLVDTILVTEGWGELAYPSAVTVDNRGIIYICDPISGLIQRYRLSNFLDEDLQPN
ncbi:MAG: hypothetical protein ACE5D8_02520 [Fidelibacterota bacterium]